MRHEFFMRFYGPQSSANALACETEMRGRFPQIAGASKGPLSTSVNTHYAATDIELAFRFDSKHDMEAVRGDEAGKAIYMRFATKGVDPAARPGQLVMRAPGDRGGMAALMRGIVPCAESPARYVRALPSAKPPNKDSGVAIVRIVQAKSGQEVLDELRAQRPRERG